VLFALGLVPFAGIAFLWFVGVLRDRVGESEDRFFATVFLGSGLLFVGALFVAAAVAAGLVASAGDDVGSLLSSNAWEVGRPHHARAHGRLRDSYGRRVHHRHVHDSDANAARPRLLVASGYAIGVALLLAVGFFAWIELAFPAWVFVLSVYILVAGHKRVSPADPGENEVAPGRGV
jgi:hypothetical protein